MPEDIPGSGGAELSYWWGGRTVGDAQYISPYNDRYFLHYLTAFARLGMSRVYGVLHTTNASYSGLLAPSNPAGTTLRMASGAALVHRYLYLNDANYDWTCGTQGYYRLVIRATLGSSVARAALLGPVTNGWPQMTRDSNIHDIAIARVYSDGATLTVIDDRRFFRNIVMPVHSGEALLWYGASTAQRVRGTLVQCGAFPPQTTPSVTFPRRYPTTTAPVVIMGAFGNASAPGATKLVNENGNGADTFDYYIDSETDLSSIYFISFGMRR